MLTFDIVLGFLVAFASSNDALDDMEVGLTLPLGLARHDVLLVLFWVDVLPADVVYVVHHRALVVVVKLPVAFVS